ncbi:E3 ubiquitin-protein ligase RING [Spatholobus suberectus]|nr:E3 ubiquitin-protein ligase RING [Spatholobus suberectus]
MELPMKPKPRDILRFDFTVTVRYYAYYFSRRLLMSASNLIETSIPITGESFFENNQDFLTSFLSDLRSSRYFIPESLDRISQRIASRVQQLLPVQTFPSDPEPEDNSECQEFSLSLGIFVDVMEDEEMERAAIEESMQQGITMIPASNEAIHSLKTFTDSLFLKSENCNICMDKFHAEGSAILFHAKSVPICMTHFPTSMFTAPMTPLNMFGGETMNKVDIAEQFLVGRAVISMTEVTTDEELWLAMRSVLGTVLISRDRVDGIVLSWRSCPVEPTCESDRKGGGREAKC